MRTALSAAVSMKCIIDPCHPPHHRPEFIRPRRSIRSSSSAFDFPSRSSLAATSSSVMSGSDSAAPDGETVVAEIAGDGAPWLFAIAAHVAGVMDDRPRCSARAML